MICIYTQRFKYKSYMICEIQNLSITKYWKEILKNNLTNYYTLYYILNTNIHILNSNR